MLKSVEKISVKNFLNVYIWFHQRFFSLWDMSSQQLTVEEDEKKLEDVYCKTYQTFTIRQNLLKSLA